MDDIEYKIGDIIVAYIGDLNPEFGKIKKISVVDGEIIFVYTPYIMIGFSVNKHAWSVLKNSDKETITSSLLSYKMPCVTAIIDKVQYIATRYRL